MYDRGGNPIQQKNGKRGCLDLECPYVHPFAANWSLVQFEPYPSPPVKRGASRGRSKHSSSSGRRKHRSRSRSYTRSPSRSRGHGRKAKRKGGRPRSRSTSHSHSAFRSRYRSQSRSRSRRRNRSPRGRSRSRSPARKRDRIRSGSRNRYRRRRTSSDSRDRKRRSSRHRGRSRSRSPAPKSGASKKTRSRSVSSCASTVRSAKLKEESTVPLVKPPSTHPRYRTLKNTPSGSLPDASVGKDTKAASSADSLAPYIVPPSELPTLEAATDAPTTAEAPDNQPEELPPGLSTVSLHSNTPCSGIDSNAYSVMATRVGRRSRSPSRLSTSFRRSGNYGRQRYFST